MPNDKTWEFHEYFDLDPNAVTMVVRDTRLEDVHPLERNEVIYFPYAFVKEYIDDTLFWDDDALTATITTRDKVLRLTADSTTYTENGEPKELTQPFLYIEDKIYLPSDFLTRFYPISIAYDSAVKIAAMDYLNERRDMGMVAGRTANLRYKPDKKAFIEERLDLGARMNVYQKEGDYARVRVESGLLGYLHLKDFIEMTPLGPDSEPAPVEFPSRKSVQGKINLVFDQVFSPADSAKPEKYIFQDGLDVLAPTWFSFDIETLNGDIISIADSDYVRRAHDSGRQVWALLSDFSADAARVRNSDVNHAVLSRTRIRERVIAQIMDLISRYDLDGINIDFEYLQPEDAAYYSQFFRELAPYMRAKGKTLSVDVYNPVPEKYWSQYYNRRAVGECVDYMIVMAYDEHTNGTESGPVASLPFVEAGIAQTLEEVPKDKVLLGLPYYARVWREEIIDGTLQNSLKNYDMQTGYEQLADRGAQLTWDTGIGALYGEYAAVEDDKAVTYKVWLEDERSIEEKLKLLRKYDLAGAVGWKRGLEKAEIWGLLKRYLK
ncbi:MAG: hypothetical protein LBT44_07170 [Clostridiales bacterium]|nr:hypothetical protein [Clostridiales bacterium]